MILDAIIQLGEGDDFYRQVIVWSNQCWQLYALGQDIDLEEFKRRMNVVEIDYKNFFSDNIEQLELRLNEKLILLRILHVLYPDEYTDPDKE